MALEQILNNKKSTSFVLINDTIRFSSLPLLADISKRALDDNKTVIALLTETSPKAWRERFSANNNIFIIDCYSDPYGWDYATETQEQNTVKVTHIQDMEKAILSSIIEKTMNTPDFLIVVDSVIPLAKISQHRTYQFVKTLESLTTDTNRLVLGYHSDIKLASKSGLSLQDSLTRLASVIIKLEPLKERTHFETQSALTGFVPQDTFSYLTVTSNCTAKGGIAHVEWRKKSGKVLYESSGFLLNSRGYLDVVPISQLTGVIESQPDESETVERDNKSDPTANLSFNLSLTDEQRKVKENLVLPFMKAQQLEVSTEDEKKSSLIYYDPDAADDFDDEDPDEDLDI
ncbi:Elongator complex protein 5 [Gilbertella persicaria]|uniref:Elongator complex protein 5 n=1 Tax=Gilbertella persicaria TaxID=101096 RepID=UPI00221EC457|nr:Elongator complex protein 5 [Gilbertella persicaria]KAI8079706.1 Elongator complex protein 5 [Gilbertella persicaria]